MKKLYLLLVLSITLSLNTLFAEDSRLLRYPNASDTQIAFCHGGDVFTVPIIGGLARRVTSSDGLEMYPRFSPDGKTLAFTAEYDGNREIYTVNSEGGTPERITYSMDIGELPERMGPDKIIMQWTPGGDEILYRSRKKSWNVLVGRLYKVNKVGGLPEELPLPKGGYAYLSPDGKKIAYNRVFREYRTWKRYRGGQADDIWVYDFETEEIQNITNNPAQDIIPMWTGNKIYYLSDRTKRMNLYVYDINSKQTKQVTDFKEFDVKFPSLGANHIAFQNGGYIYLLDIKTDEVKKINIEIREDWPNARPEIINVKDRISAASMSPAGERVVFTARGDVFNVPSEKGKIWNLTKISGAHDRNAVWSPDGKWIAYVSDKSGEDEIYLVKPDGSEEIQLTSGAESYRYELEWSPDSKKLICSDKTLKLYYFDVESKKRTDIIKSKEWEIRDYTWSPDSKWIAFTDNLFTIPSVNLYSLESGDITRVSDPMFAAASPEFSTDGKYLFFVSDRTFNPTIGNFEYNFTYNNMSKIYGITLQTDIENPFAKYEEDEVEIDDKKKDKKDDDDNGKIEIDLDGIIGRIFELPVSAGNYSNLISHEKGRLYYSTGGKMKYYDFEDKEEKEVGDFGAFDISHDGKKVLFKKGSDYYIDKLTENISTKDAKIDLTEMKVNLNHYAEWKQIFNEAWRQMKYFFYDPDMHGVDWGAVKAKYAPLVEHVVHRTDLTYLIGEMIGELNVGHAYVGGGDMPDVKKVPVGLLGAEFELDEDSGYYKITRILPGRNWEEKTRSPLTEPGVEIEEGDYIIAIDGIYLTETNTPYKALVDKAREYVKLTVNSKPSKSGSVDFFIKTIASEKGLYYLDWVETNRRKVSEATDGKVGYIHIPDMMPNNGLNEFVKYFYPQAEKEALIIDDRYNGGGNVSPMVIERLRRILVIAKHARNQDYVGGTPGATMTGPLVCLINQQSMSDGDLFPYQFRKMELGKLIGERTWGGVIGIRGSLPFLDGGNLYKPEFANFDASGDWVIEGEGVEPDIFIKNHPGKEYRGVDQQLQKAIEVIKEEMKKDTKPDKPPVPKEFPDKK